VNSERVKLVALTLAALSLLVPIACGGDGGGGSTSPDEWADSLCTELSTWRDSVAEAVGPVQGGGVSRQELENVANEVADATEALVGGLQDLDRPDIEAGQEAQDEIDRLADELQTDIGEVDRAAESGSANAARASLNTMTGQVSSAVQSLEQIDSQGELRSAFEQSDACRDLTRS
jgi:hypothetical protein